MTPKYSTNDVVQVNRMKGKLIVRFVIKAGDKVSPARLRAALGRSKSTQLTSIAKVTMRVSTVPRYVVSSPRGNLCLVHEGVMSPWDNEYKPRETKMLAEILEDYPSAKINGDGELDCDEWNYVISPQMLKRLGETVDLNNDNEDEEGGEWPEEALKPLPAVLTKMNFYPAIEKCTDGNLEISTRLFPSLGSMRDYYDEEYGDEHTYGVDLFWLGDDKFFSEEEKARYRITIPMRDDSENDFPKLRVAKR